MKKHSHTMKKHLLYLFVLVYKDMISDESLILRESVMIIWNL